MTKGSRRTFRALFTGIVCAVLTTASMIGYDQHKAQQCQEPVAPVKRQLQVDRGEAPACVLVRTNRGRGSGAVLPDGRIATALHVVIGSRWIEAHGIKVVLVTANAQFDVAILTLEVPLAESPVFGVGTPTPGAAYIYTYLESEHKIVRIPVRVRVSRDVQGQLVFTGWMPFHGSSGSPLVQHGKVVGVITRHHFGIMGTAGPLEGLYNAQ